MNNTSNFQSWLESVQNCTLRTLQPCIGWLPCLQRQHQVHPESGGLLDSKFLQLSSQRRIRIVHIENASKLRSVINVDKVPPIKYVCQPIQSLTEISYTPGKEYFSIKSRSHSMISNTSEPSSDDYWFTRWSQPLRISDTCNCSFRKSWRKSLRDSRLSNHVLPQTQEEIIRTNPSDELGQEVLQDVVVDGVYQGKPHNSTVIEKFVEIFIQEILRDTFNSLSQNQRAHSISDSPKTMSPLDNLRISELNCTCSPLSFTEYCNESLVQDDSICQTKIFNSKMDNEYCIEELTESTSSMKVIQEEQRKSSVGIGCVNPNFLGSTINPDMLDSHIPDTMDNICESTLTNVFSKQQNVTSHESGSFNTSEVKPHSSLSKHSHSSLQPFQNNPSCENNILATNGDISISSKMNAVLSVNADMNSNTDTKVQRTINNQSNITASLNSIVESNQVQELHFSLPEAVNQNVNIRKKSNTCHHTASTKRLKPILFFLHGVGCSADLWTNLLQYFVMNDYEVVAPDMLGHGYSSAPDYATAYIFHHLLKDALDIFDKFVEEQKKCVVIGHAYGCSLATAVARYRPQQVAQLVLISGGGPTPLAPSPPSLSPCLQACIKPLLMCGFRRDVLYAPCGKHISSGDALSSGIPPYVLRHIAQGQDWPEGDSAFHRRILVPTLLVHGTQDPYVTLVQECEMERTIPRSFLELIPNAGHFAMLETPGKLSHMIHCFIDWWSR